MKAKILCALDVKRALSAGEKIWLFNLFGESHG